MKVILKETIDTLGIAGSECEVAPGYGRNYLLPQGKAMLATPQNRRVMEQARAKLELQIAKEKKLAEEMAEKSKAWSANSRPRCGRKFIFTAPSPPMISRNL